jgi:anti-anti-sigma factor
MSEDEGVRMSVSSIGALPIEVRASHRGQEVAITGRIDVHSVPDVRLLLHEIIDTGCGDVLMRLGAAEIGDATGLGLLVEAYNRARRAGRRLAVVDMTERTGRLLRASRLDRALVLRETPDPLTVVAVTA